MNIAIIGFGRMGREIESVALERGHSIAARFDLDHDLDFKGISADVAIDFSHADALFRNVSLCLDYQVPVVVGTTGWSEHRDALRDLINGAGGSLIHGSNFSVGMQMFRQIVVRVAEIIDGVPDYDVMIHELHHKAKADSPSGTALSLSEIILATVRRKTRLETETSHQPIDASALHVSSTRGGDIAGTHSVIIDSQADTIELIHRAKNRRGFALGAVLAAEWIVHNQGFHDFADVFTDVLDTGRR